MGDLSHRGRGEDVRSGTGDGSVLGEELARRDAARSRYASLWSGTGYGSVWKAFAPAPPLLPSLPSVQNSSEFHHEEHEGHEGRQGEASGWARRGSLRSGTGNGSVWKKKSRNPARSRPRIFGAEPVTVPSWLGWPAPGVSAVAHSRRRKVAGHLLRGMGIMCTYLRCLRCLLFALASSCGVFSLLVARDHALRTAEVGRLRVSE
jgi:hypothetical protein